MSKQVITLTTLLLEAAVDADGKLTELHYAAGPYVNFEGRSGELLLCGRVLMYDTHNGVATDAVDCVECVERDG